MAAIIRTLAAPATYRRLAYLLLGMPLGLIWFTCLITLWSLSFGLAITPFVIPVLLALAFVTRGFITVEASLARALLEVDVHAPALPLPGGGGVLARIRALFGPGFWRSQGYLWTRWFLGFPAGVLMLALLGTSVTAITGPLWIPFVHGGYSELGFWHVHGFLEALALVPFGLVLLPLTIALAKPLGDAFRPVALGMLRSDDRGAAGSGLGGSSRAGLAVAGPSLRGLAAHAYVEGAIVALLILIWALTSGLGYFWPVWVVLPFALALSMHAWVYAVSARPELAKRFLGSRSLATTAGCAASFWLFTVGIWAMSRSGSFWPVWVLLAAAILVGTQLLVVRLTRPGEAEMAERIESLTASRAGAVNVQDSELRRIERDLHDGAQARLVALGMSLGMAEQKLSDDPERAGQLLAEARAGAEQALRELRDLARGIHPPVLADRGLEAAIEAIANATPMHVALSVDVPKRPPSAVESAAYFVAAESIANAAKHAPADWLEIRIAQVGHRLELEITDDGVGGADPQGSGLTGLRHRVEALDGKLEVTSPPAGPTTVYAEIPWG